jgi:uncharacterized protein (DUF1330 family)
MTAYLVADIQVTDAAGYEEYRRIVGESIAAFGGRFLTRGGTTEVVEGSWRPKRLVIVEFPTMEQLRAWYASPAYAPALALRKRCAVSNLAMAEGIAGAKNNGR